MSATVQRPPTTGIKPTSILLRPDDKARIDTLARKHQLSRTAYMVRASLGELGPAIDWQERVQALEARVERLEQIGY